MKNKNTTRIALSLSFITTLLVFAGVAHAAYAPQGRNLCSLGIYPYNPGATSTDTLDEYAANWFNLFNQNDSFCTEHLVYANAYKPQPPEYDKNPLKSVSGIESKKAPYAIHSHRYFNDSVQDDNYYYKSIIDKFEVTLQSDALNNNNFETVNPVCYTYPQGGGSAIATIGCNSTIDLYGGTKITYNTSTGNILWEFGVNNTPKKGRPIIYGKNPDLNGILRYDTNTDDPNRKFPVAVKLVSKNSPSQIWSGTTTSRILLRDQAILKTAVNLSASPNYGNLLNVLPCASDGAGGIDYTKWCTLPSPTSSTMSGVENTETVDGKSYYWFKIGIIGTVWKKTTPLPPQGEYFCKNLTISPSDHLDADGETDLRATVTLSDGSNHTTEVGWSQTGSGTLDKTTDSKTATSPFNFFNHFSTTDTNATAGVKVLSIDGDQSKVDNPLCKDGLTWNEPPKKDTCEELTLTEKDNGEVCANITGTFTEEFQWKIGSNPTTNTDQPCQFVPPNTSVEVYATDNCQDQLTTRERPPKLTKGVRVNGSNSAYKKVLSINSEQKSLQYQLVFETDQNSKTSATITDDISFASIDGKTYPTDMGNGRIEYISGSMIVKESGIDLQKCSETITENCYTGDIGAGGVKLVKVSGPVTITYRGTVTNSAITPEVCKSGTICQEKYMNRANARYDVYNSNDTITQSGDSLSNDTVVQLFCQYILARAAGDIYLEKDLDSGIDIRRCSKYENIPGIIVKPAPPPTQELGKTGIPSQIFSINHEICTEGQAGTLPDILKPFYGQEVATNLSSSICEVKLQTSKEWQKSTLVNSINENKTRISRWEPTVPAGTGAEINSLNKDLTVYHIKGGNLTVNQDYTLSDGDGAKTFIVEDGDLIINKNIKYGTCNKTQPDICTVRDTASLAFIVLNGSVYVDPSVTEISGVYFVQAGDPADAKNFRQTSGQLFSGSPVSPNQTSTNKLEVFGSIYGDINPLFSNRIFSGDPALEEAGIVIRFDERIILNTPPGLRDVLSLSQTEVAR